jgi:hypothetical protein
LASGFPVGVILSGKFSGSEADAYASKSLAIGSEDEGPDGVLAFFI